MRLGYHVSILKFEDFENSISRVKNNGANVIQFFLADLKLNNRKEKDYKNIRDLLKKENIICYIHSSYTINIAQDWDERNWSVKILEAEFDYAHKIGAKGIVIHLGKKLDLTREQAFNNMFSFIAFILNRTKYTDIDLLLETSSGQGTEMCYTLEEFSLFFRKLKMLKNRRIGICIDSCHIFAAGYDIRNKDIFKMYIDRFEEMIGLKYIRLVHLNDSKKDVGSRLDRHEDIGKGYIGFEPLKRFFKFFTRLKVPIILETPSGNFKKEIKHLLN